MSNVAVLKTDKKPDEVRYLAESISKAIEGTCFIIPLDQEILFGLAARKELELYRDRIDKFLQEE